MVSNHYKFDAFWKGKRLIPAQLLGHDGGLGFRRPGKAPRLEINEIPSESLLPGVDGRETLGQHFYGGETSFL